MTCREWALPATQVTLHYRRRLPHGIPDNAIIFVTWRLAGCLPPKQLEFLNSGRTEPAFLRREEAFDRIQRGPAWLRDPRVASMLADTLNYGATVRKLYTLHAWAVMPNHVHVVFEPHIAMPKIMRWIKGRTSRVANRILGPAGEPFCQDESFDHWIRNSQELANVIYYVERNPVKAGLVSSEEQWRWSSAWGKEDAAKADGKKPIVCPTCYSEIFRTQRQTWQPAQS